MCHNKIQLVLDWREYSLNPAVAFLTLNTPIAASADPPIHRLTRTLQLRHLPGQVPQHKHARERQASSIASLIRRRVHPLERWLRVRRPGAHAHGLHLRVVQLRRACQERRVGRGAVVLLALGALAGRIRKMRLDVLADLVRGSRAGHGIEMCAATPVAVVAEGWRRRFAICHADVWFGF